MLYQLEVENICKCYGNITAVNNISFRASTGVIALLGPNGAGKSTLMNMLAGYLAPDSGTIKILNCFLDETPQKCKTSIGFLPEGSPLYSDMSVKTFLNYIGQLRNVSTSRISEVAELAQITNVWNQKIETLSKGYQRRVGFAQSILSDPEILLLDEPTDGLDPNQKEHIQNLIKHMGKNKTILISTHLLDEAETIADRIIIIDHGAIKADGTLAAILRKNQTSSLGETFKKLTKNQKTVTLYK